MADLETLARDPAFRAAVCPMPERLIVLGIDAALHRSGWAMVAVIHGEVETLAAGNSTELPRLGGVERWTGGHANPRIALRQYMTAFLSRLPHALVAHLGAAAQGAQHIAIIERPGNWAKSRDAIRTIEALAAARAIWETSLGEGGGWQSWELDTTSAKEALAHKGADKTETMGRLATLGLYHGHDPDAADAVMLGYAGWRAAVLANLPQYAAPGRLTRRLRAATKNTWQR